MTSGFNNKSVQLVEKRLLGASMLIHLSHSAVLKNRVTYIPTYRLKACSSNSIYKQRAVFPLFQSLLFVKEIKHYFRLITESCLPFENSHREYRAFRHQTWISTGCHHMSLCCLNLMDNLMSSVY